jgi:hypothetical protein
MAFDHGPRPPGDAGAMRTFARGLLHAADVMQADAQRARHTELGFDGPAARRVAARVSAWLAHVDRDAEGLRDVARRVMHEAGGVESAQRRWETQARAAREAEASRRR